jgi:hypothetical protein
MVYPSHHGASPYHASEGYYYLNEDHMLPYGIGAACGGQVWKGVPAQAGIDIDFGGSHVGRAPRRPSQVKKEHVIFPRRKAGQSKRQADNEAPIKLTPLLLEEIANIPLVYIYVYIHVYIQLIYVNIIYICILGCRV